MRTGDLAEHPRNPRIGDIDRIVASIEMHGFLRRLVVQKSTNYVLAGCHALKAARRLGLAEVPCYVVDVDEDAATRIMLADNRCSDLATYDEDRLIDVLSELGSATARVRAGFSDDEYTTMLAAAESRLAVPGGAEDHNDRQPPAETEEFLIGTYRGTITAARFQELRQSAIESLAASGTTEPSKTEIACQICRTIGLTPQAS